MDEIRVKTQARPAGLLPKRFGGSAAIERPAHVPWPPHGGETANGCHGWIKTITFSRGSPLTSGRESLAVHFRCTGASPTQRSVNSYLRDGECECECDAKTKPLQSQNDFAAPTRSLLLQCHLDKLTDPAVISTERSVARRHCVR